MAKRFTVVTILPELILPALEAGVVGRAAEAGTIVVDTVNPRDFTHDRHRTVDDTPYGGGPGMVMKAEPLLAAIAKACEPLPAPATPARSSGASSSSPAGATPTIPEGSSPTSSLEAFGRRVLRGVESTLSKLEEKLGAAAAAPVDDEGAGSGTRAETAVADAEAALAELEAQLGGRGVRERSPAATTAGAGVVTPAEPTGRAGSPARPTSVDDVAAEATLAELEMELGMRAPAEDLAGRAGRRFEQKILGPAIEEPAPGRSEEPAPGPTSTPTPTPTQTSTPSQTPSTSTSPSTSSPSPTTSASSATTPASASVSGTARGLESGRPHRILMSPSGAPLTQARVRELAAHDHLVLVCGRYEGIDQRVIDMAIDEEISIGDYVLSGGELAALVVIDAVARLVPGVLGEPTSADDESFSAGLLEYPQYTRPQTLDGRAVPPVLQSGNHAAIAAWRRQQSLERTASRRPDLFRQLRMTKADRKLYAPLRDRTHIALVHYPVLDRTGAVVTTSVTNFDIHDLARSSMTYGLAGYHIVTPITSQREKAAHIASLWQQDEQGEHRAKALRLVRTADAIDTVIAELTTQYGRAPTVVGTSAKAGSFPGVARRSYAELVAESTLDPAPLLILFGTGWGFAESMIPSVSRVLAPVEGDSDWNHLSVRSATAIILDRLFGRPA